MCVPPETWIAERVNKNCLIFGPQFRFSFWCLTPPWRMPTRTASNSTSSAQNSPKKSLISLALTANPVWDDKEQFLDTLYWFRYPPIILKKIELQLNNESWFQTNHWHLAGIAVRLRRVHRISGFGRIRRLQRRRRLRLLHRLPRSRRGGKYQE